WEPTQPLSGTRCITRETWEACLPLAPGWGVETSLTIDALTAVFWVKEIPAELHHRATGKDLRGKLHQHAKQRHVVRTLARRLQLAPVLEEPDLEAFERSTLEEPEQAPLPSGDGEHDEEKTWTVVHQEDAGTAADRAEQRRITLADP